ncbi:MAG: ABC transporter permease [Candidatus Obscuribacterales bacterium]|nr:ABC transporter permease [Steroidobacteraceae bacterium]
MSLPLVRKELQEHGAVLVAAFVVSALALVGFLIDADRTGGRFTALVRYVGFFGILNALVLSNRLFVREYTGRTQLFLEILPISRARVFITKWLLGFALIAVTVALAWLVTLLWVRRTEVIALNDSLRTLASVGLCGLSLWAFSVMAGMLGRYRYAAWVAVLLCLFAANYIGGIAPGELPLFRLLGSDVGMALGMPSTWELLQAGAVILVCTIAAAALALVGSGAMASALAHKMTIRERVFLAISLLAFLTLVETLTQKPIKPPFQLTTELEARGKHSRVGVMETVDVDAATADALAKTIAADVDTLIDSLGFDIKPTVFILPQQGLDPSVIQRAALGEADGIVLKVAPNGPRAELRAQVLHSLLLDATLQRAHKEDRHVLLDGLAAYWVLQNDASAREQWWLRAAAISQPLRAEDFTRWSHTSEQHGECFSQALAFAAFDVLVQQVGHKRALALMRTLFVRPHDDVRALFETEPATLLKRAGVSWTDLADRTEAARIAARARHAETLSRRAVVAANVTWRKSADRGVTLEATLEGAPHYWVLYQEIFPWTADVGGMSRLDVRGSRATLPLSPSRGARVLAAIELDDAILGCPIRVFARRITLP